MLADLASVEQRLDKQTPAAKGDKSLGPEIAALERAEPRSSDGVPIYRAELSADDRALLAPVFLLTNKPALVVVNIGVDQLDDADALAAPFGEDALAVCMELEATRDVVAAARRRSAPSCSPTSGSARASCPALARGAASTCSAGARSSPRGDDEIRAWTFRAGAKAPECAGVIHSDLQRGFIRAEVIDWQELLEIGSWTKAKEQGKLRVEGKDYEVVDGDVLEIRFNV